MDLLAVGRGHGYRDPARSRLPGAAAVHLGGDGAGHRRGRHAHARPGLAVATTAGAVVQVLLLAPGAAGHYEWTLDVRHPGVRRGFQLLWPLLLSGVFIRATPILDRYLASGFVQMTPRNDFNSDPKANPKAFEHGPGYAGYPNWVDDKTPPSRGASNYFTRLRDFYWTQDQASFKLTRTGEDEISVELGNSMPFFKKYVVKIDGTELKDEVKSPLVWKLKTGDNKLEVVPVDEFGKVGLPSTATVKLGK